MNIRLNGNAAELADNATIGALLGSLNLHGKRVAVEVNGHIVPRSEHAIHKLTDGDKVEVVHAIGGGQPPFHR